MDLQNHWILRVADGKHFWASAVDLIWGITSNKNTKSFLTNVKEGDILWFLTNKSSGGKLIAVASFVKHNERVLGPLIPLTKTNEDLGWTETPGDWDTEIHYNKLYDITDCDILPNIKGQLTVRKFNEEKCEVNLLKEYENIKKYSRAMRVLEGDVY